MEDVLELTMGDHASYNAICNVITKNPVNSGKPRSGSQRLSSAKKYHLLDKQNFACHDCLKPFPAKGGYLTATAEHVIPYRFGGTLTKHNCILLCQKCNQYRDRNFSLKIIENHFGKIDRWLIDELVNQKLVYD